MQSVGLMTSGCSRILLQRSRTTAALKQPPRTMKLTLTKGELYRTARPTGCVSDTL
jgi:hypothetical protein